MKLSQLGPAAVLVAGPDELFGFLSNLVFLWFHNAYWRGIYKFPALQNNVIVGTMSSFASEAESSIPTYCHVALGKAGVTGMSSPGSCYTEEEVFPHGAWRKKGQSLHIISSGWQPLGYANLLLRATVGGKPALIPTTHKWEQRRLLGSSSSVLCSRRRKGKFSACYTDWA